jgi:hypothetical protein
MTTRDRVAELVQVRVTGEPVSISAPSAGDIKAGAAGSGAGELLCRGVVFTGGGELRCGWNAGPVIVGVAVPEATEGVVVEGPAGAVPGEPPAVPGRLAGAAVLVPAVGAGRGGVMAVPAAAEQAVSSSAMTAPTATSVIRRVLMWCLPFVRGCPRVVALGSG